MDREQQIKAAHEAFEANKQLEVLHVTEDGQCFALEHDAKQHLRFLAPHMRGIVRMTRESVDKHVTGKTKAKAQDADTGAGAAGAGTADDGGTAGEGTGTSSATNDGGEDTGDAAPAKAAPKKAAKKATKKAAKK